MIHSPAPLTILRLTNNLNIGGVQKRLATLLPLLAQQHTVHCVTYRQKGYFFDLLPEQQVHTHYCPLPGKLSPKGISRLAALMRELEVDVVHTHSLGANIPGLVAARLARVPVRVAQIHTRWHWYGKHALKRWRHKTLETLLVRRLAHAYVASSPSLRDFYLQKTQAPPDWVHTIPNGMAFPQSPLSSSDARVELGLPAEKILIGFVARLVDGKGVLDFINLIETLASNRDYHFVLGGDGPLLPQAQARVQEKGLSARVTFLGQLPDPTLCYAALDLLCSLSEPGIEALPSVAVEAAGQGVPILARYDTCFDEVARQYTALEFLDPTLPPEQQVQSLLNTAPDTSALRSTFSVQAMAEATLRLYTALLGEAGFQNSAVPTTKRHQ